MRACIAALAALSASCTAAAQETVLRTTTRLVQVNVIATGSDGAPVADLAKDDFTLTEDGRAETLRVFSMQNGEAITGAGQALPAGFFSNRLEYKGGLPGSATALLFDVMNTPPGYFGRARPQITSFLRQIDPRFRIAIYVLNRRGLTVLHDFATDTALLTRRVESLRDVLPNQMSEDALAALQAMAKEGNAMDALFGQGNMTDIAAMLIARSEGMERDFNQRDKTLTTLRALTAIGRRLGSVPGRKNLVWITAGIPVTGTEVTGMNERRTYTFGADLERALKALAETSVAVYPIDVRGLLGLAQDRLMPENRTTMQQFAVRTGGKAYYGSEVGKALPEAFEHSRISYTLAYYPSNQKYDGRFRKIEVRVRRAGVRLTYRSGYYAERDAGTAEEQRKAELLGAVWSPVDATAIPLDVSLERSSSLAPNERAVVVRVEGSALAFEPGPSGSAARVELFFVQKDAAGKQVDGVFDNVDVKVPAEKVRALEERGMTHRKILSVHPQTAVIRVVARNPITGALGSLSIPFTSR
ncbi:MAG TPA: VWA domain-containing protein [Bryobacteraceae bacterium]|nr:VWA domain-containing protein [Bryobacteraceae bacterium]